MLQDSFGTADDDMRARALREQQVEAQRLLEATQAALAERWRPAVEPDERDAIERLLADGYRRTCGRR